MGQAKMADVLATPGETSRLGDLLHRLALAGSMPSDQPEASANDDPASVALRLILREIDETVLPRHLTVFDGDHPMARLVVSNRRLLALEYDQDTASEPPSDSEAAARLFARQLRKLTSRARSLGLRATGRASDIGIAGVSCSAQRLAQAAGLSETEGGTNQLDAFLDHVKPFSHGWARTGEDADSKGGDADLSFQLAELIASGYGQPRPVGVAPLRPECAVLPLPEEVSLVMATEGRRRLLAVIPTVSSPEIMSFWAGIYRTDG